MTRERDVRSDLKESAHRIWLAGLGALAMAGEEGKALFETLVERGTAFEGRSARHVEKVKDKVADVKANLTQTWEQVQAGLDERVAKTLDRLGVPSRGEIANLTKRVEDLTRTIEKLQKPARTAKKAAR